MMLRAGSGCSIPADRARQRPCVSHANRLQYANQLACETVDATVAAWHRNLSPRGLMLGVYLQKGYNLGVQWRFPPLLKVLFSLVNAGIAQLVEQLICNQQVIGSNPIAGSLVNSCSSTGAPIFPGKAVRR